MGIDHHFTRAIVRQPPMTAGHGLTTAGLGMPDFPLLAKQHVEYVDALRRAGLEVEILPAMGDLPDSYFVEDAAIVLPDLAVLTRPAAPERAPEPARIAPTLSRWFPEIAEIRPPGFLDGGDVLITGNVVMVGLSERTNREGADQLGRLLAPLGYELRVLEVKEGLHLKSGLTPIAEFILLGCRAYAGQEALDGFELIEVAQTEAYAANALRLNDVLLLADGHPEVNDRLDELEGVMLVPLEMSEIAKMDGGLSCLSLRW